MSSVAPVLNRWRFRTHILFSGHEVVTHVDAAKIKPARSLFVTSRTSNVELNYVYCENDKKAVTKRRCSDVPLASWHSGAQHCAQPIRREFEPALLQNA